jgi:dynein light chain Tctex-type 1
MDDVIVASEIKQMALDVIEDVIGTSEYTPAKAKRWNEVILGTILEKLAKMQKPFKYAVNCSIIQRTGAGFLQQSACYFIRDSDEAITAQWKNENSVDCIVHIFAFIL